MPSERRFRRFVVTAMLNPFTLPVVGASLLASVALGVHLGESSVGLINPIYFQEPPLHPRDRGAAIDERSLARSQPAYAELYGWEQGHAAIAADCGNCEALRARDAYSARVPYFGSRGDVRVVVADARELLGDRFAEVPADLSPRRADVERYAYYPVSDDERPDRADRAEEAEEAAPPTRFEFKEPPWEAGKDADEEWRS